MNACARTVCKPIVLALTLTPRLRGQDEEPASASAACTAFARTVCGVFSVKRRYVNGVHLPLSFDTCPVSVLSDVLVLLASRTAPSPSNRKMRDQSY